MLFIAKVDEVAGRLLEELYISTNTFLGQKPSQVEGISFRERYYSKSGFTSIFHEWKKFRLNSNSNFNYNFHANFGHSSVLFPISDVPLTFLTKI